MKTEKTLTVQTRGGSYDVHVYARGKHLAVTREVAAQKDPSLLRSRFYLKYVVTHVQTGCCVARYSNQAEAIRAMRALDALTGWEDVTEENASEHPIRHHVANVLREVAS